MERAVKEQVVQDLKAEMAKAAAVVLADFRGLTVEAVTGLRREFRAAQCQYKVVKNTLLTLAVKGTHMEPLSKLLEGPTAMAYSVEDAAAPAKIAAKFAKDQAEKFVIKGGYVEGKVLDANGVAELSRLPGKNELRAKLLATFNAPATEFVRLISAGPLNFLYLLAARKEKLEKEGGAAAAAG
jgi:large subunit ribosomal protein L10